MAIGDGQVPHQVQAPGGCHAEAHVGLPMAANTHILAPRRSSFRPSADRQGPPRPSAGGPRTPYGGTLAGGSIRRQRSLKSRATSHRSGIFTPTTGTTSRGVVVLILATRTTSRRPVALVSAAGPRRLLAARDMRYPQHAASVVAATQASAIGIPRMTDGTANRHVDAADGRYGCDAVGGVIQGQPARCRSAGHGVIYAPRSRP